MRTAALLLALTALVGVGAISVLDTRDQLAMIEACDAAARGDAERALALTEGRVGPSVSGRAAAECRCAALLVQERADACAELLEPLVGDPPRWTPAPELAALLIQSRKLAGRSEAAAELATAAATTHPSDPRLFRLELELRSTLESEEEVLKALLARIPATGDGAASMRTSLAQRHLMRGDPPAALRALGDEPPPETQESAPLWYDTLGITHAMNDDLEATQAAYARWRAAGGRPREVRARYAVALSVSGLTDPKLDALQALRVAVSDALALGDARLAETAAVRLIFTLVASGDADAALSVYDEVSQRIPLDGVQRDELERARQADRLAHSGSAEGGAGWLHFELPAEASDATLWLSPEIGAEPDAAYQPHPIEAGGSLRVQRRAGPTPQRWVLRDPDSDSARASGTLYPRDREVQRVVIPFGAPAAARVAPSLERQPADGRRRVVMLLLDCGDWPLLQYLRTRGDLPTLDALFTRGYRAVLDSDPPLTAAALEAIVWPERRGDASLFGTVYRFGVELAGLESVGRNPLEWLSWVMPESADLFSTLGAGELRVANLLLAHGGVRAGRHGQVHGPFGGSEKLALGSSRRPLDAEERQRFPELAEVDDPMDAHYIETIAAEFDTTHRLLESGDLDLIAVRIEPLDILTHAHFGEAVRESADNGRGLLFETYRYLDARIGALHRVLDEDDVLIVFSDHGIETAMEHARPALFVANGAGIPRGRAPGRPELRGVSRVAADLLGVPTQWPATGVAHWAESLAQAR